MPDTKELPSNEELINMIKQLKGNSQEASSGWENKKDESQGTGEIQSINIPISVRTDSGKLRVYLTFDGAHAATPEALSALIDDLTAKGLPLDIWQQKKYSKKGNW